MVNCSPVPCRIFTIELDDTQDESRLVIDITEGWIWDNQAPAQFIGLDISSTRLLDSLDIPYAN